MSLPAVILSVILYRVDKKILEAADKNDTSSTCSEELHIAESTAPKYDDPNIDIKTADGSNLAKDL